MNPIKAKVIALRYRGATTRTGTERHAVCVTDWDDGRILPSRRTVCGRWFVAAYGTTVLPTCRRCRKEVERIASPNKATGEWERVFGTSTIATSTGGSK